MDKTFVNANAHAKLDGMQLLPNDTLLVIDLQNDFCPGGALAVEGGDEIVPVINSLGQKFAHILLTQDWHPPAHISFASSHPGMEPYGTVDAPEGAQTRSEERRVGKECRSRWSP